MSANKPIPTFENFEKKSQRLVEISGALTKDTTLFPMNVIVKIRQNHGNDYYSFSPMGSFGLDDFRMEGPHRVLSLPNVAGEVTKQILKSVGGIGKNREIGKSLGYASRWDADRIALLAEDQVKTLVSALKALGMKYSETKSSMSEDKTITLTNTVNDEAELEKIVNAFKI